MRDNSRLLLRGYYFSSFGLRYNNIAIIPNHNKNNNKSGEPASFCTMDEAQDEKYHRLRPSEEAA